MDLLDHRGSNRGSNRIWTEPTHSEKRWSRFKSGETPHKTTERERTRHWKGLQLRSNKYYHSWTNTTNILFVDYSTLLLALFFLITCVYLEITFLSNINPYPNTSTNKQTNHNTNDRNVLSRQEHRSRHNDVTINPEMESKLQLLPSVTMETRIRFSRVQYRSRPTGGSRGSRSIRHTMISVRSMVPSVPP